MASIKVWQNADDFVLKSLCQKMVNRNLYHIDLQNQQFEPKKIKALISKASKKYKISEKEAEYFVFSNEVKNEIYRVDKVRINIIYKDSKLKDISEASDQLNSEVLAKTVKKYFLCYPKDL